MHREPRRPPLRQSIHRAAPAGKMGAALLALAAASGSAFAGSCQVQSGATVAPLVEMYTSEGCNSCPPADRWLSRQTADPTVVALAFHVDYWDRLGWADRFASPAYTQRQAQQRVVNGARFNYTPQVVVGGVDRTDWPAIDSVAARPAAAASRVALSVSRDGERYRASVRPGADAPARLAAYWALTESAHVSTVKAGENSGATLRHDAVVRELQPVGAWPAGSRQAVELVYQPTLAGDSRHPRRVVLVVVDAANGKPLQAAQLAC